MFSARAPVGPHGQFHSRDQVTTMASSISSSWLGQQMDFEESIDLNDILRIDTSYGPW